MPCSGLWKRLPNLEIPGHKLNASGHVALTHGDGRFDMHLYMNAIPGVPGLSLMYGQFKLLDGAHSTERDLSAQIKGECWC
jgi:hypothetical protein